jgi:hypothetical protein
MRKIERKRNFNARSTLTIGVENLVAKKKFARRERKREEKPVDSQHRQKSLTVARFDNARDDYRS